MANGTLFGSLWGRLVPPADRANEAGGPAYSLPPKAALAQYAATGCLNTTYYASDRDELDAVLALCGRVEPEFVAKTAVFARQRGFMKDQPALLAAALSVLSLPHLEKVFDHVIDDARMVRSFVQILRSGAVARRSLGRGPKRLVQRWLAARDDRALFFASVGSSPSLADVVRMVHPRPATASRAALYAWLLSKPWRQEDLPEVVRRYEAFKQGASREVPDVPFQMLTHLPLGPAEWRTIAERATWHQTRMNLNTFARRGLFSDALDGRRFAGLVARRLADPALVHGARVFPYQLLAAYLAAGPALPDLVRAGLQKAMDVSLENVPALEGQVYVCPDVSGSMSSPVTGHRKGATTAVRCVDVAALLTAAVLRRNPTAQVLPFEQDVVALPLDPRASVLENARRLASIGGGGTNCSAPLARLNRAGARGDLVIYVSDNESWCDPTCARGTATLTQWQAFRARNPGARMACVDLQPHGTVQAPDREDVLNVGGFSDHVFTLLADFAAGRLAPGHWVSVIERIDLDAPPPPRTRAPDGHGATADEGTTIN